MRGRSAAFVIRAVRCPDQVGLARDGRGAYPLVAGFVLEGDLDLRAVALNGTVLELQVQL